MYQAVETYRVVRRRGAHIIWTIGLQMAVRLQHYALAPLYPQERFLVFISVRG
jgi:hypothetical protein